jgi:hypothetical protein
VPEYKDVDLMIRLTKAVIIVRKFTGNKTVWVGMIIRSILMRWQSVSRYWCCCFEYPCSNAPKCTKDILIGHISHE